MSFVFVLVFEPVVVLVLPEPVLDPLDRLVLGVTAGLGLARDLEGQKVRFQLARDVGLVRDILRRAGAQASLQRVYPTVQTAVDAALRAPPLPRGGGPPDRGP